MNTNIIYCQECKYQTMRKTYNGLKEYNCELNDDPYECHAVNGRPGEFCSSASRREETT